MVREETCLNNCKENIDKKKATVLSTLYNWSNSRIVLLLQKHQIGTNFTFKIN